MKRLVKITLYFVVIIFVAYIFIAAVASLQGTKVTPLTSESETTPSHKSITAPATALHVWLYTPQSIQGDYTITKVQFDYVLFDRNSEWDIANYRWTAKEAGIYAIEAHLAMTMNKTEDNLQLRIHKNGELIAVGYGHQNNSGCAYPKALTLLELKAGDYIEVFTAQDTLTWLQLATEHSGLLIWRVD